MRRLIPLLAAALVVAGTAAYIVNRTRDDGPRRVTRSYDTSHHAGAGATSSKGAATVRRIAGADRYATAAAVAQDRWDRPSDVLLANGANPSDALAGAYASGLHSSPLFLTERDTVPQSTLDALTAMHSRRVHLLGGTGSISQAIADQLAAQGYEVLRHAGADRYGTAAAIARSEGPTIVGSWQDEGRTAIIANGRTPWDALAGGPLAAGQLFPLLLTETDSIPPATQSLLDDYDIQHVIVLGGTGVVSDGVIAALTASGRTVRRVAGADRMATAVAVAGLLEELGLAADTVALASATSTADAMAAGPWGAPASAVLLCESPSSCGEATTAWAAAHDESEVVVFGGSAVISDGAAGMVAAA
jgi:putative cell wall-binding protein